MGHFEEMKPFQMALTADNVDAFIENVDRRLKEIRASSGQQRNYHSWFQLVQIAEMVAGK